VTSEVVVMNSLAVALAADSAATVSDGIDNKIYNSANKLFMLSKHHPVGVMVYNNASLLGIPWETILKMFREKLADTEFETLEEYGLKLIEYLDKNTYLFPESTQGKYYLQLVETLFRGIFKEIRKELLRNIFENENGQEPKGAEIAKIEILKVLEEWRNKPNAQCFENDIGAKLAGKFSGEISDLVTKVFDGLALGTEAAAALRDLAILVVAKDEILTESLSGLVIAGFGRAEFFPVMQIFELGEVFLDRLKYRQPKVEKIDSATTSVVRPFAQSEMVDTFLRGVNPLFEIRMIEEVVSLVVGLPDVVIDAITDLTEEQRTLWKEKILPHSSGAMSTFVSNLEKHRIEKHLGPIRQAIISLPIDELAHVAASLVNLNSFQKRMSFGPETVGGPIDVAVISKGDGFIWIERKHYFRRELNHHFFRNYDNRTGHIDTKPEEGEPNGE